MRVAFVIPEPILPATSGGRIHALSVIGDLQRMGHEVTAVCRAEGLEGSPGTFDVEPVRMRLGGVSYPFWRAQLALKRGIDPQAGERGMQWRTAVRQKLNRINPDVVIWYHTFGWFPNPWPSVLFAANVETDRLAREGSVRRWQLKFVRCRERDAARRASLVLALSEPDQRSLAELSGRDVVIVSPSVQAARAIKSQHGVLRSVCFVGSFDYRPNVEAAERIVRLNPLLRERAGIEEFVVAGRRADRLPNWVKQADGLTILSDVPDMSRFLTAQDLLLVPLENGGGVRIKILEAFAAGLPVVSTPVGAEGLVAIPGQHIALGGTDEELVDAVKSFSSPDVRSAVASAALDLWKHHYSSDAVAEALDSAVQAARLRHWERQGSGEVVGGHR